MVLSQNAQLMIPPSLKSHETKNAQFGWRILASALSNALLILAFFFLALGRISHGSSLAAATSLRQES